MRAFIFAAGLGTRLKPLTDTRPKALVKYHGKPMIDIVIDTLKAHGVDSFLVNIHHFGEQIIEHLQAREDRDIFSISDERDLLRDTGGAIRHAALHNMLGDEPFLVHNVDIMSNLDLRSMQKAHKEGALATLLVSQRETSRYLLFDNSMRLVGWTNIATGEVKSPYADLDVSKCTKRAFGGIHIMDNRVGQRMTEWREKFSIIDFYLAVCQTEPIYGYEQPNLQLTDIGKLSQLQ